MKRLIAILTVAASLVASAGQAGWRMKVHEGATATEFSVSQVDSVTFYYGLVPPEMVAVPAGSLVMGDGYAYCGVDEREVILTRDFYLGRYEVTNDEYVDALQWAFDNGYVTATTTTVLDNLDGSVEELVNLDDIRCEIAFSGGVFSIRDAGYGINSDHPVKEVTWHGAARFCDWLSLYAGLPRAYEHAGDWACNAGDPYGAQG